MPQRARRLYSHKPRPSPEPLPPKARWASRKGRVSLPVQREWSILYANGSAAGYTPRPRPDPPAILRSCHKRAQFPSGPPSQQPFPDCGWPARSRYFFATFAYRGLPCELRYQRIQARPSATFVVSSVPPHLSKLVTKDLFASQRSDQLRPSMSKRFQYNKLHQYIWLFHD